MASWSVSLILSRSMLHRTVQNMAGSEGEGALGEVVVWVDLSDPADSLDLNRIIQIVSLNIVTFRQW